MPVVNPTTEEIREAAKRIQEGKLVAFPTETVYGLGANALDGAACSSIFTAKKRPASDPLIVHICDVSMLDSLVDYSGLSGESEGCDLQARSCREPDSAAVAEIKAVVSALAEAFWPGPLTLVLPKSSKVPAEVSAGGNTVGVRFPDNVITCSLIRESQRPIAGPSANKFGHISPTSAQDVASEFEDIPDLTILDGGPCRVGIESTVLSVGWRAGPALRILRRGLIAEADVSRALELRGFSRASVTASSVSKSSIESVQSPGQFLRHYSSSKPSALLMACAPALPGYKVVTPSLLAESCWQQLEGGEGSGRPGAGREQRRLRALLINSNDTLETPQQVRDSFSAPFAADFDRAFEIAEVLNVFSPSCFRDIGVAKTASVAAVAGAAVRSDRKPEGANSSASPSSSKHLGSGSDSACNTARNLFWSLRYAEEAPCDLIVIIPPAEVFFTGRGQGLEAAAFDRMFRSASGATLLAAQPREGL